MCDTIENNQEKNPDQNLEKMSELKTTIEKGRTAIELNLSIEQGEEEGDYVLGLA